jgi:enoyl-CoA hydratase/carnithine racemase
MSRVEIRPLGNGVVAVALNRPEKHNGVDWKMLVAWRDAAVQLAADREVRAVILHGEGESFCSGLDFGSFTSTPGRNAQAFMPRGRANLFQEVCRAWRDIPAPVIAVLHGRCFGAGIQLALAADFRYTTPDCQLSVMEAKWGLIPDMSGSITLRELVGIDQAKLLTFTGRAIDGVEAARIGLVTDVVDDPMAVARSLADEICTRSPDSVAVGKQLLQANWFATERQALARERWLQLGLLVGGNFREAMKANFQKRPPSFKPRSWMR